MKLNEKEELNALAKDLLDEVRRALESNDSKTSIIKLSAKAQFVAEDLMEIVNNSEE